MNQGKNTLTRMQSIILFLYNNEPGEKVIAKAFCVAVALKYVDFELNIF